MPGWRKMNAVNRAREDILECLTAEVGGRYLSLISHYFHPGNKTLHVSFIFYLVDVLFFSI